MEVIYTSHGEGKLATKVCFGDEPGFCVASVIVMGQKECVLIDCQWDLANAHRVIAEILDTGLELKAIFASHMHPDHYWGMGVIEQAFPRAKCYMLPEEVPMYADQYQHKLDDWIDTIGEGKLCRKQCENLLPLEGNVIELEGERIEIIPHVMGDLKWNSIVWIPSIRTVYGSDVVFNQAHPFTCEVTAEQRREWIAELDKIAAMDPISVIPGHQKAGCPLDTSGLKFTKDYLIATEEELEKCKDAPTFFYRMEQRFPNCTISMYSNEMNAGVFYKTREWDWSAKE